MNLEHQSGHSKIASDQKCEGMVSKFTKAEFAQVSTFFRDKLFWNLKHTFCKFEFQYNLCKSL